MICCQPDCENEATVHLTEIVEGQMKKIDLCEECAQEKGVTDPEGFALAVSGVSPAPRTLARAQSKASTRTRS